MQPVSTDEAPRHETPNAVMHTLAAPSLGTAELSVWEVAMRAGQRGPEHSADREQVWVVLDGELQIEVGESEAIIGSGAALTVPAGASRQITATRDARALVASVAAPNVATADGRTRPLPWAA